MFCDDCKKDRCIGFAKCNLPAKGRIVEEYRFSDGSKGVIMNSSFINKALDELAEVDKSYQRISWSILLENLKTNGIL